MGSSTRDVITLAAGKPTASRHIEIDRGAARCVNEANRA
jgi:hypothetical protein